MVLLEIEWWRDLLESLVERKVESQLAVLAPVRRLGARASLDDVLGEGNFHQGLGGVNLDIGRSSRASRPKKRNTNNADG